MPESRLSMIPMMGSVGRVQWVVAGPWTALPSVAWTASPWSAFLSPGEDGRRSSLWKMTVDGG